MRISLTIGDKIALTPKSKNLRMQHVQGLSIKKIKQLQA